MMTDHTSELNAFNRQRTLFFAEAGECIIEYQKVEEFTENIFVSSLGGSQEKASGTLPSIGGYS